MKVKEKDEELVRDFDFIANVAALYFPVSAMAPSKPLRT